MILIDTHCHLNDKKLLSQVAELVTRAKDAGVTKMHVVGYDEGSSQIAIELAERFPEIYAIIGLHPTEVVLNIDAQMQWIEKLARHEKVIAIGETGLDYYWHKDDAHHELQKIYLIKQIELANRVGRPLVIHSRDAMGDTLSLLQAHPLRYGGVMHCYSGSVELVPEFIKLGLYISLAGPVTFLNAKTPKEVAKIIPRDRLLIETDSPYLAPHPYRGQRNEPALLPLILKAVASARNENENDIAEVTTANAERLFHVKHL